MNIKSLKVNNSRLTEGEYYPFKILKTISIDHDCPMFVMQDPLGYKVLMPANFYNHYGFKAGQIVQCRVDKINCNGRMFLEPQHPHYKEGEVYDFPVLEKGTRKNFVGEKEHFVVVRDVFDQKWAVIVFSENCLPNDERQIKCRIDRIKKGKLFLSIVTDIHIHAHMKIDRWYEFEVTGARRNPVDNLSYFILKDKSGIHHPLKKKYYTHYGIRIGNTIRCKAVKFTSEGFFHLEPENPWYRIGEKYLFRIIGIHKLEFSDGSIQYVLVVDDPYRDDVKIFIEPGQVKSFIDKTHVECLVQNVRKSRLELQITGK
jgi:hypothetical protein